MSNPFVAEIRIFPFNFAPIGWAFCDGQILPLSQNTALFSLLGTTYGGDGKSNFALPNLQGAAPLQAGQGVGLSLYDLGETGGAETVQLLQTELPSHSHGAVQAINGPASSNNPSNNVWAVAGSRRTTTNEYSDSHTTLVTMSGAALSASGSGAAHNNMSPYLTLNFCIALQGVFPPRS